MTIVTAASPVERPGISGRQVVVYLLTYAARGFYAPFIGLYLLSVGFSPVEIGLLTGVSALVRLIVVPAYSTFVDRLGEHRKLLSVQFAVAGAATLGLVLWPQKMWMSAMYISRDSVDIPAAALMGQLSISGAKERGGQMYGKLRATGSLGWAVASIISGPILALPFLNHMPNLYIGLSSFADHAMFPTGGYAALVVLSGLAYAASVFLTAAFPERTAATNSRLDKPPKRLAAFWLIMGSNLLYYLGMNAMSLFMFVYFKQHLGADDAMVGVFAALLGLFEVPWMIGINRIYRYIDTRTALWLGLAGQAVFAVALALMTGIGLMLPMVIFRGFFYALHNISLTLIVTEISHPANVATNQAITWVTMPALAAILMGPVAGWMYEFVSPPLLFTLSALIILVSATLLTVGRGVIDRGRSQRLHLHVN